LPEGFEMIKEIKKYFRKEFIESSYPSFYLVNIIGWIILITIDTLIVSPELLNNFLWLINNTVQWLTGFFITIYLRAIYKEYQYRTKSIFSIIFFIIVISALASILFYFTAHIVGIIFNFDRVLKYFKFIFSFKYMVEMLQRVFPLLTTWSLLYFGIKLWLDLKAEREKSQKADLLAQSAQLQMLRYQINPHFLFNSFSSLRALIRSNQSKAEMMVTKLSEFYRYTLVTKSQTEVPLIDEIQAIANYAEIEKIRFEDKIEFDFKIDPVAEEYPIPSFLIHPLVENSIKYGMKSSTLPLRIYVIAKVEENWLIIQVINSGKLLNGGKESEEVSTGTGLSNVKSRLEYSYPNKNSFNIVEEDNMVKVTIKILRELKK
jgi:two-component system LytT family sensor kinase